MQTADFLVIGAGIAGASVAAWLAPRGRTIVLERESQPGYHSTGRSAAMYLESYGTAQVRALTAASRAFFDAPPDGFADHPILAQRGLVLVATPGQEAGLAAHWDIVHAASSTAQMLDGAAARDLVPVLRPGKVAGAVFEPDAFDMDVHALHQGFLRRVRRAGGSVVCDAGVEAIVHRDALWQATTPAGTFAAPVLVNAAGAWADAIAQLADLPGIGLQPKRRSAFIFAPPPSVDVSRWPLTGSVEEDWYFKPDAGMLLGSPANVDPVQPHDVQPEEMDIALAIHRIEEMTTLSIRRPTRTWAGLRSFVADGDLVGGWDTTAPGFFWVAAQGGYGIQTCAAMGEACAALASGETIPGHLAQHGVTEAALSPARLGTRP